MNHSSLQFFPFFGFLDWRFDKASGTEAMKTVKGLFIKAVNILTTEKDEIAANFQTIKGRLFDTGELETEQSQLQEELNVVAELIQ